MRSNRRVSKKLLILVGLALLLSGAYLHFGLLPGRLNDYATEEIEKSTPFKVRFDKILYLPFRGFCFYNLKVMEKTNLPVFSAKKLSLDIKLIPFLKEKKIVVANVYLHSPVYDVLLEPRQKIVEAPAPKTKLSGAIPVPVIKENKKLELSSIEDGPDAFLPENVYLEQIEIVNGLVTVRQNERSPLIEKISSIDVRMGFQKPPQLTFDGSIKLGDTPYCDIKLKGTWDLDKAVYEFLLETKSQKVPAWLLEYQKNSFLILKNGAFTLNVYLKSLEEPKAYFRTQGELKDATIIMNKAGYAGQMRLGASGVFNFDSKSIERYRGDLELFSVTVSNLSKDISRLDNINGRIYFEPNLLKIESVRGQYKNVGFEASGAIRSFKDLLLNADIRSHSRIAEVLSLFPEEHKKLLSRFDIQGNCDAVTRVTGSLRNPSALNTDYRLVIEEASIKNPEKKINVTGLNAEILADSKGFQINHCRFVTAQRPYVLNAVIPKEKDAPGTLDLKSDELKLSAAYRLQENAALIEHAEITGWGISATCQGKVFDFNKPLLNIQGNAQIDLDRIMARLALSDPALKGVGLKGTLNGIFVLNGLLNDPLNWDLKIDAKGNPVFLNEKIRLDNLDTQIRMRNRIINIPFLHATPYGGTFGARAFLNFSKPDSFFSVKVNAFNINLYALGRDLDLKQKDFAGTAVFRLDVSGTLKSPQTYRGTGVIDIRNGNLWKTSQFKKMGKPFGFIVPIEGLDVVTFTSLSSTFDIHDKRIWSQNINLFGTTVDLSLKGSAGFDQSLDLSADIRYSSDILRGARDVGALMPVEQAEDFLPKCKITGTIKEPKVQQVSEPIGAVIGKKISNLLGI